MNCSSKVKTRRTKNYVFFPVLSHILVSRRGTTDDFATIPFYLVLFSAALAEPVKSIPVHSLILSFQLFFCLPLFFPFTVPCRIVFGKPEDIEAWPTTLVSVSQPGPGDNYILRWLLGSSVNLLIGNMVIVRNI